MYLMQVYSVFKRFKKVIIYSSNASLKCPAGKDADTWSAMKYGEARMLGLRTYPQGRFEVFVRS